MNQRKGSGRIYLNLEKLTKNKYYSKNMVIILDCVNKSFKNAQQVKEMG